MVAEENSRIRRLVNYMMGKIQEVADDEDWAESDGWVGKWTIYKEGLDLPHDKRTTLIYEIKNGKFNPTSERSTYTGEVEMTEDTFLYLLQGAFEGHGEETFAEKYAMRHIRYRGNQWVVDSERFRKVLKRMGSEQVRKRV